MKNPNLTKEEYKILEKEYDEFGKLSPYEKFCEKMFLAQFLLLFFVFILPIDIFDKFPFLNIFTNFMNEIFINIKIYTNKSKIPEICEFYLSYIWLILVIFCLWHIYKIPHMTKEARKYFGTGEFKNKGILKEKFIPLFKNKNKSLKDYVFIIFITIFFAWCIFGFIVGNIVDTLLGNWMFHSRFGLFIYALFQNLGIYALFFIFTTIFLVRINLKRLKNNI
ncbi:Uncharacterised protein [Campylobacter sputorum subsp. bubulus]|uniref:Uncharacterized protein n=1 Tax=Campylobacter sputorum subsp. sputorum TaxID=32024 RepID=A0A381DKF7_9BACT|nr:hypothetical protein [Campylobacter sputorum]ASM34512.1 putative membrane protein [Campylobacter sputorum aubsp. sputorum RM3237]KAB0580622.1 hypothetical protein F7P64_08800 [Campylobacter sputorum subsp. sputorum]QEL04702.1 putative membrane protein [Campylobacter sputorum subsp. sputorum]SUX09582.1 Uncharacterised protein [Campylobacter sputorum subsp. bubulus]SUX11183.1 Uncharacterised protein [Campylobacter sputorum subsp. sputorum]